MDASNKYFSRDEAGPRIAVLILAAGASTRLGRPKQLVLFRERSLLRHAAETALASACRPVVVVLGALAERLQNELAGLPVTIVNNTEWEEGMASSIRAGLKALPADPDGPEAVVIMLCDQPLIPPRFLDQLAAVHRAGGKSVVAAEYGGSAGVPALFTRACFPDLAALRGLRGAQSVIRKFAREGEWIPLPEAKVDIDQEEDVQEIRHYLPESSSGGGRGR